MIKILIPMDTSEYAERALEKGKAIADLLDSRIVLLNVISHTFPFVSQDYVDYTQFDNTLVRKIRENAEAYLEKQKESFGEHADKVETIILDGSPADRILEYLDANEVDLIIMGSQGLGSRTKRLLMGSVTSKVLHYAKQPILVIK
ncbi:universal stress protein [Anaerobium acetethylicum]|uniref:Nucleotide-binding universal stress protein, UspA family n=1 Tax=Anaerobium acetethylicum TaxID=1619234 RepID=A0A1D3TRV6_9FIRM|nr:universal stress protein [Anaerobium acetethylicum]SCP96508.1 Nucleotide-binding universal stress protein, UspA family [Anaerobium acetethylicum]